MAEPMKERNIVCFHNPEEENGYLSNWYPSQFEYRNNQFNCAEQYMMIMKAAIFGDWDIAEKIHATDDPKRMKALGRQVKGFNSAIWDLNKEQAMIDGLTAKFQQNEEMKEMLLATGNSLLAECAVHDKIWGIGRSMWDQARFNPDLWNGQNLLGKILMKVRDTLREEEVRNNITRRRANAIRDMRAVVASEHTATMNLQYADEIKHSVDNSKIYDEKVEPLLQGTGEHTATMNLPFADEKVEPLLRGTGEDVPPELLKMDTTSAIFAIKEEDNIALLNFASFKHAGGGYMRGMHAQEEALCCESFLYNVLSQFQSYYDYNLEHLNRHLFLNRAIYSPDVYFFRDGMQKKCGVITCAAPDRSCIGKRGYDSFTAEENQRAIESRVEFIKNIALANGVKTIILGAWGCGVFKQDPTVIKGLFVNAFMDTGIKCYYAIPDDTNYKAFAS